MSLLAQNSLCSLNPSKNQNKNLPLPPHSRKVLFVAYIKT
jgi:hypothetical protein